jgi:HK97 family phage major capsid protein
VAPINTDAPAGEKRGDVHPTDTPEYRSAFEGFLRHGGTAEQRALQADIGASGGFVVLPMSLQSMIWQKVDNTLRFRQLARVQSVGSADSLGCPTIENDPADADWTAEISQISEDSTMSFGRRDLKPQLVAKLEKVSMQLLAKAPNVESIVGDRLAYKVGVTLENAYYNGDGNSKPLGLFTASDAGIPTSRDVSTGNTNTAITFDGLINAVGTIKEGYLAGCGWHVHRDFTTMARKLKDGQGQYLWQPSLVAGQPDTILGFPVYRTEYAPNTFTAGLYVGVFGNLNYYQIADGLNMSVQRLNELYARTNQIGFIVRAFTDGMPIFGEAFARVKLA